VTRQPLTNSGPEDINGVRPVTTTSYNTIGQPQTMTDPEGLVTQFTYHPTTKNL